MAISTYEKIVPSNRDNVAAEILTQPHVVEELTQREVLTEVITDQLEHMLTDTYRNRRAGFTHQGSATIHEFEMFAMRTEGGGYVEELVTRHEQFGLNKRPITDYEVEIFSEGKVRLRINIGDDGFVSVSEFDERGRQSIVRDVELIDNALFELEHRISDSRSRVELRTQSERDAADADAAHKLSLIVPPEKMIGTRFE